MPAGCIQVETPESLMEFLNGGALREAVSQIGRLAGVDVQLASSPPTYDPSSPADPDRSIAIAYNGVSMGRVRVPDGANGRIAHAAHAIAAVLEHALDRETAVADLAESMLGGFEELNCLYALIPAVATRTHLRDVGEWLVEETARTLRCGRVSLLLLEEKEERLRVVASRGLPAEAQDVSIPLCGTISGAVLLEEGILVVNDEAAHPDLQRLVIGGYKGNAFAVVRVPLVACGEPLGVLTATEREGDAEFTARDRKLLEGLSALGASSLLNCRLHGAVTRQMVSTIQALASAVDAKDHYTHDHSARVAENCVRTARALGVNDSTTTQELELSGLLHDIGKIGVPDSILMKTDRLSPDEFAIVKTHAEIGARIVKHVDGLHRVAKAILHHHERYDGIGYPAGLSGEAIPFMSRLITIADVFDCLTTRRPYRTAISADKAIRELIACRGTHFDPEMVDAFVQTVGARR